MLYNDPCLDVVWLEEERGRGVTAPTRQDGPVVVLASAAASGPVGLGGHGGGRRQGRPVAVKDGPHLQVVPEQAGRRDQAVDHHRPLGGLGQGLGNSKRVIFEFGALFIKFLFLVWFVTFLTLSRKNGP